MNRDIAEVVLRELQSVERSLSKVEDLSRGQASDYEESLEKRLLQPQGMAPTTPKGHLRLIQAKERKELVWLVGSNRARVCTLQEVWRATISASGCVRRAIMALQPGELVQREGATAKYELKHAMSAMADFAARSSIENCEDVAELEGLKLRLQLVEAAERASRIAASAFDKLGDVPTPSPGSLQDSVALGKASELAMQKSAVAESAANYAEISSVLMGTRRDLTSRDLRDHIRLTVEQFKGLVSLIDPARKKPSE